MSKIQKIKEELDITEQEITESFGEMESDDIEVEVIKDKGKQTFLAEEAIKQSDGFYFPTQNKNLFKLINIIKENGGLSKFTYIYVLTQDRNPFYQVSNYNGSSKALSRKNFFLDIKYQFEKEYKGSLLILDDKAPKIDYKTGEVISEVKNGKVIIRTINEYELLIDSLEHVHAMDFDSKKPHSQVYENEENGRKVYNTFCAPKRLREMREEANKMPRIDKIDKFTARDNGYMHVYALFFNLLNPNSPENKGEILYGNENDDTLSFFFNRQAYIFQTLRKTNNYILFSSEQGVGKNTYYKYLNQYLLGKEKAYLSSGDAMNEQFSGYMLEKLYIAFDEAEVSKKSDASSVANRIKKLTNEDLEVRAMQQDRFNVSCNFNLDIFTNKDILMQLEFKDRRCFCVRSGVNLMRVITRMGYSTFTEFEEKIMQEMDAFILDILRLNYNENMAVNGVVYSPYRKRIISKTNKRIDIITLLIKEKRIKDIKEFFAHAGDSEEVQDLCRHVEHNFLTGNDCKYILHEIMEDFDDKGNDFDKNKFWNDNFGALETVKYKNDEGKYTSKSIRKLNKFTTLDLEMCFNLTAHNPAKEFDDFVPANGDGRDFLDMMEDGDFLE